MKRVLLIGLLFLLLVGVASAAVEITDEKVILEVDYSQFNDEDQKFLSETGELTVKNVAEESVIVDISFSGLPSGYSADEISSVVIEANSEKQVSFSVEVTHEEKAGLKQHAINTIAKIVEMVVNY